MLGFGISFAFAAMANLVVAAVDPGEVGIATGINTIGSDGIPTENAYTEAFLFSALGALLALAACLMIPRAPRPHAVPADAEPVAA